MHLASHFGCFQALRALLRHTRNPARPVVQNEWLYCALHFAAMLDRADGVELLLEAGGTADHIDLRDKARRPPAPTPHIDLRAKAGCWPASE